MTRVRARAVGPAMWLTCALTGVLSAVAFSASQQAPAFRGRADSVRVDVAVLDRGRPVAGLAAGDFEIFDNGTPQEILANRELLDLFLPGLRADFALSETYVYARARKLSVPTRVFYGEHDEIEERQIHAWQEEIEPEIRFERLPGGHFFIHSHLDQLTALVGRAPTLRDETL